MDGSTDGWSIDDDDDDDVFMESIVLVRSFTWSRGSNSRIEHRITMTALLVYVLWLAKVSRGTS
jgi:hypothetical protein